MKYVSLGSRWFTVSTIILAGFYLAIFVGRQSGIRFDNPSYNYVAYCLLLTFWIFLLVLIFKIKINLPYALIGKVVVALIVLYVSWFQIFLVIPLGLLEANEITKSGEDKSMIETQRIEMYGDVDVVAYTTNGGATTSFGTVVRSERDLPFGLKQVREITGKYGSREVTFEKVSDRSFRIKYIVCGDYYVEQYGCGIKSPRVGDVFEI